MIAAGAGWRFQEHIATHAMYEDQVIEHEASGHLAVRRVYAAELSADPAAAEFVRGQARALARVEHPAMPRFYGLVEIEGRVCWMFENLRGQTLRGQLRARGHLSAGRWAAAALDLIELLRDLSRAGVSVASLRLEDLVVLDETVRIANLAPAPKPLPGGSPASLVELATDAGTGAWFRGDPRRQAGENAAIIDLLFHLAAPGEERSLTDVAATHDAAQKQLGSGAPRIHSALGIEAAIEGVLMRFHRLPEWKWDEFVEALLPLADRAAPIESSHSPSASSEEFRLTHTPKPVRGNHESRSEPVRQKQVPWTPGSPSSASSSPPSSSSSSSSSGAVAVAPSPTPPAGTTTAAEEAPVASPRTSTEREVFARSEIRMEGTARFEEDASEDRTYLIPEQREEEKSEIVAQEIVRRRKSLMAALDPRMIGMVVSGLVLVALIVGAAMVLPPMLAGKKAPPNQPPVASFVAPQETFAAYQKVRLDASASADPEGRALLYSWTVRDLPADQWRIEPNKSRDAAKPELQVYAEGTHIVELKVFDDAVYSQPTQAEVTVGPPVRQ